MDDLIFSDPPNVELLQWLARDTLKKNLGSAIRLWVWLRTLYSGEEEFSTLDEGFTNAKWRDAFFSPTHPKNDKVPELHDENCPCAKTIAYWLFETNSKIIESQWKQSLISHAKIEENQLDELLKSRLFAVTRRSLQSDLKALVELRWLEYKNNQYYRVAEFPTRPGINRDETNITKMNPYALSILHEDINSIANNLSQEINGIKRFYMQLDYVIPKSTIDRVEDWQYELKELWTQTPVPPIQVTYDSARVGDKVDCIVFPVCIYYVQRAVYLCAYGESPDRETDWYNFRLDRIVDINPLDWENSEIPGHLQKRYQQHNLPNPDEISIKIEKEAWGFDFYLPPQLALLRFDRDYHERYIKDTVRHQTFEYISHQQAQRCIEREAKGTDKQILTNILTNRSSDDAYYQVYIRYKDSTHRDNNIIMRLRAWRPRCEVIFPLDLRESFAADVAKEYQLYC